MLVSLNPHIVTVQKHIYSLLIVFRSLKVQVNGPVPERRRSISEYFEQDLRQPIHKLTSHIRSGSCSCLLTVSFRPPLQWPSQMPLSSLASLGHRTASPSGVYFLALHRHPLDRHAEGSAGESVLLSSGHITGTHF